MGWDHNVRQQLSQILQIIPPTINTFVRGFFDAMMFVAITPVSTHADRDALASLLENGGGGIRRGGVSCPREVKKGKGGGGERDLSLSIYPSLSLSICLSLSLSIHLSLSLSIHLSHYLSIHPSLCLFLSLSLSLSVSVCLSLSVCLFLSLSLSLSKYLDAEVGSVGHLHIHTAATT